MCTQNSNKKKESPEITFIIKAICCTIFFNSREEEANKKKIEIHFLYRDDEKKKCKNSPSQRRNNVNYDCLISVKAIGHCNIYTSNEINKIKKINERNNQL